MLRDGVPHETGMGNAEIGSYLTHLGLSLATIQFITAAPADQIRWLSHEDADRLGISIEPGEKLARSVVGPDDKPAYAKSPSKRDPSVIRMIQIASLASNVVLAMECKKLYRINSTVVLSIHSRLMDEGDKLGKQFPDFLGDELKARAREIKRDGLARFCARQRDEFLQNNNMKSIYLQ